MMDGTLNMVMVQVGLAAIWYYTGYLRAVSIARSMELKIIAELMQEVGHAHARSRGKGAE